uniref:Spermidine/putrescine import ATP-binding protein PotA n=1 Tax=Anthurium amnicola TaxID=1678845 RepID=A0A1D1ZH25_9ARAE
MDATWAEITGSATGERRLKKNRTWDSSTRVQLEQSREAAGRRELRKSQTFQEESAEAVAARRAVLERRMKGKEVEVAADHNVMDRQFDDFIEKVYGQLRLQRQESLRRRYLEITP